MWRDQVAGYIRHLISERLFETAFAVVALAVLFGAVATDLLVAVLLLLVAVRGLTLAAERQRPAGDILIELAGTATFLILLPAGILLFSRDFVSVRSAQDWQGLLVLAACWGLCFVPHLWAVHPDARRRNNLWWGLPVIPVLGLVLLGVADRHPYLDPTRPDHLKLRADRILALPNNVIAGRHPDWVIDYARELELAGDEIAARAYYDRVLALAPQLRAPLAGITPLVRGQLVDASLGSNESGDSRDPYWEPGAPVPAIQTCNAALTGPGAPDVVVLLIRTVDVSEETLYRVSDVVGRELQLGVCVVPEAMPLPSPARTRGLIGGPQWDANDLVMAVGPFFGGWPAPPRKFVVLTAADMYFGEANFVFSMAFPDGAIVSGAQFTSVSGSEDGVTMRVAKQTLGALVKTFGVTPSPDQNCVSSYAPSIAEFEAKGNRPAAATLARVRDEVERIRRALQAARP